MDLEDPSWQMKKIGRRFRLDLHRPSDLHPTFFLIWLNRWQKSCRLRWLNYLKPNIKKGEFQPDEVDLMVKLHKWSLIAGRLLGRTTNDVMNYWNTRHTKKWWNGGSRCSIRELGEEPITHLWVDKAGNIAPAVSIEVGDSTATELRQLDRWSYICFEEDLWDILSAI
ncbi:hypothetical protein ACOSQ2_026693 [Xanthoceras sorbifolium]